MLALILPGNSARDRSLAAPVHPIPVGQATSRTNGASTGLLEAVHLVSGEQTNPLHRTMIGRPTKKLIRLARRCPSSPYGFSLAGENGQGRRWDGYVRQNKTKINLIWM